MVWVKLSQNWIVVEDTPRSGLTRGRTQPQTAPTFTGGLGWSVGDLVRVAVDGNFTVIDSLTAMGRQQQHWKKSFQIFLKHMWICEEEKKKTKAFKKLPKLKALLSFRHRVYLPPSKIWITKFSLMEKMPALHSQRMPIKRQCNLWGEIRTTVVCYLMMFWILQTHEFTFLSFLPFTGNDASSMCINDLFSRNGWLNKLLFVD